MSHRTLLACAVVLLTSVLAHAQETQRRYLSGTGTADAVRWDFFCTAGARSGQWTSIPVPSCWDALGFGSLNYGQDKPPYEQGKYKRTFTVPPDWKGQRIDLVFDGVLTDTQVRINGHSAGDKHQGGFYRFSYDITPHVKFDGENLIEVTVDKHSADESVNRAERRADYWMFGGIFRPVWLEAKPPQHIERVAIDAKADGTLAVDVFTDGDAKGGRVAVRMRDVGGPLATAWRLQDFLGTATRVETKLNAPKLWTAETPNLYELEVQLMDGEAILHRVTQRFGFRTIEVRPADGIYVNGRRIILKGSNRHSFHPETGRALSATISRDDVLLLKEMNHNAVRMSHYPPDEHFLDACDELGLYVLDELAGWQKYYDEAVGRRLIGQMIRRDVNHPSIIFWDNGNEGGWNTAVDDEFAKWDPQKRALLHPWELFRGINTRHYRPYDEHVKLCNGPDVYFPTEFLHGMYDGGSGAGLADYWDAILKGKTSAGGFIWATVDEAVKRPDTGEMDTAGNQAPDGIVGPYREKEAGFYTIKELWSPIQVRLSGETSLRIENRYDFIDARDCKFKWTLRRYDGPWDRRGGHLDHVQWETPIELEPGTSMVVTPDLKPVMLEPDSLVLRVEDPQGRELWTWVWPLREPKLAPPSKSRELPFAGTLRMAGPGKLTRAEWRKADDGWVELDYAYTCEGEVDFHGISFDLPEESVNSMRWLGQGPHRVWKNRLAGTTLGVWENPINDTITGHREWVYPEFRGCYAGVRWMRLETTNGPIVIAPQDPSLYVQVLTPKFPKGPLPATTTTRPTLGLARHARANLPDAGLSILHAIPPIGNKFHRADQTGPQGQKTQASGEYKGRVRFFFGEPPLE